MGYEAQIAGLAENNPFSPFLNPVKKLIKKLSVKDVYQKRAAISQLLTNQNITLEIFNGGGTGSLRTTCDEPWITEVTAGSGFLQSHLFDYLLKCGATFSEKGTCDFSGSHFKTESLSEYKEQVVPVNSPVPYFKNVAPQFFSPTRTERNVG